MRKIILKIIFFCFEMRLVSLPQIGRQFSFSSLPLNLSNESQLRNRTGFKLSRVCISTIFASINNQLFYTVVLCKDLDFNIVFILINLDTVWRRRRRWRSPTGYDIGTRSSFASASSWTISPRACFNTSRRHWSLLSQPAGQF